MPSVMQKIVAMPDGGRLHDRVRRAAGRDEDAGRVRAGLADRLGDRVEDRHRPVEGGLAALARRDAGDDPGAVLLHRPAVELALAAGDALDEEPRLGPDDDAHAAAPRAAATAFAAASSSEAAVAKCASSRRTAASAAFVPDDPDDHRHVALLDRPGLDQAARHLVAAGDAAEDVDQDRVDLRVGQDDPHRRRDLVGPRPAADVEEVGRLAAGPLDEVHRGHRQARAVDHAADRAVELDERQPGLARLAVGRVLLVGVAQRLELGVARERRVVERDLGVEADEPLDRRAVGARSRGRSPAG